MESQVDSVLQDKFFEEKIIKSLIMSFCFQQSEISPNGLKTTHTSHICIRDQTRSLAFWCHVLRCSGVLDPLCAHLAPVLPPVCPPCPWFFLLPWPAFSEGCYCSTSLGKANDWLQGVCSDYPKSPVMNPSLNLLPDGIFLRTFTICLLWCLLPRLQSPCLFTYDPSTVHQSMYNPESGPTTASKPGIGCCFLVKAVTLCFICSNLSLIRGDVLRARGYPQVRNPKITNLEIYWGNAQLPPPLCFLV